MYKGRWPHLLPGADGGREAPIKDTPLGTPWRRAMGIRSCSSAPPAYDTHHCPGEVQAWPFTFARDFVGRGDVGWCRTEDFRSSLGNFNRSDATAQAAMAVSGAAVSPGLGQIRLGSVNALIVLANLRLGVWLPAPRT